MVITRMVRRDEFEIEHEEFIYSVTRTEYSGDTWYQIVRQDRWKWGQLLRKVVMPDTQLFKDITNFIEKSTTKPKDKAPKEQYQEYLLEKIKEKDKEIKRIEKEIEETLERLKKTPFYGDALRLASKKTKQCF